MVGIIAFGLVICIFLAPETRGLNLAEASGAVPIGSETAAVLPDQIINQ
jgi:hypothetical protein